jgi:integrase
LKLGSTVIEEHPKGSGKYRVRARKDGKMATIASGLARGDARETAAAYAQLRQAVDLKEGVTFGQFGDGFLDRRELAGVRAIRTDRAIWKKHVKSSSIGKLPVSSLTTIDVIEWRDGLRGAHRSRLKLLNLVRVALREAVERGLLLTNPAADVRLHRSGAARATDDLEGILTPDEQHRLLAAVTPRLRPLVAFALFTGIRQAEQWWLGWEDAHDDRVVIRRSTGGKAPKSGKIREIFLLPGAKEALEAVKRRASFVFAGTRGGRRQEGKAPSQWAAWLKAAGIKRKVRWHDLRHTCATSLLAGWWGRKWSVDEVCGLLGHSSVSVTERYAKKLAETQRNAIALTPGLIPVRSQAARVSAGADSGIRTPDLCFTKAQGKQQVNGKLPARKIPLGITVAGLLDDNQIRVVRLLKLADIDPRAARPGLAFCRGVEATLRGDMQGTERALADAAKALGMGGGAYG